MPAGDLGTLRLILEADASKYTQTLNSAKTSVSELDKAQQAQIQTLNQASAGMTQFGIVLGLAGTAIMGIGAIAVKEFGDFEQAMKNVQAISQASQKDYETLTNYARELGKETSFSAKQAAEALYYLASAGFSVKDQMAAANSIMKLAEATQYGLAASSEFVATTLTAFGLEAKEAGRVTDVMAKSTAMSQGTMEKLGYSLPYVATQAHLLGWSLEETVAALSLLYDGGLKGEMAGTRLNEVLVTLLNPTNAETEAIKRLGINIEDVNPKTSKFADVVKKFQEAGLDAGTATEIFGRGAAGMGIFVTQGAEKLGNFVIGLNNAKDAAEGMAKIQRESLNMALERFKDECKDAGIAVGEQLAPHIKNMTADLEKLVAIFAKLPDPIKQGIVQIGVLAGVLLTVSGAVLTIGATVTTLLVNLTKLGIGLDAIGTIGTRVLGTAGLVGLALAAGYELAKLTDWFLTVTGIQKHVLTWEEINKRAIESAKEFDKQMGDSAASVRALMDQYTKGSITAREFGDALQKIDTSQAQKAELMNWVTKLEEGMTKTHPVIAKTAIETANLGEQTAKAGTQTEFLVFQQSEAKKKAGDMQAALSVLSSVFGIQIEKVTEAKDINAVYADTLEKVKDKIVESAKTESEELEKASAKMQGTTALTMNAMGEAISSIKPHVDKFKSQITDMKDAAQLSTDETGKLWVNHAANLDITWIGINKNLSTFMGDQLATITGSYLLFGEAEQGGCEYLANLTEESFSAEMAQIKAQNNLKIYQYDADIKDRGERARQAEADEFVKNGIALQAEYDKSWDDESKQIDKFWQRRIDKQAEGYTAQRNVVLKEYNEMYGVFQKHGEDMIALEEWKDQQLSNLRAKYFDKYLKDTSDFFNNISTSYKGLWDLWNNSDMKEKDYQDKAIVRLSNWIDKQVSLIKSLWDTWNDLSSIIGKIADMIGGAGTGEGVFGKITGLFAGGRTQAQEDPLNAVLGKLADVGTTVYKNLFDGGASAELAMVKGGDTAGQLLASWTDIAGKALASGGSLAGSIMQAGSLSGASALVTGGSTAGEIMAVGGSVGGQAIATGGTVAGTSLLATIGGIAATLLPVIGFGAAVYALYNWKGPEEPPSLEEIARRNTQPIQPTPLQGFDLQTYLKESKVLAGGGQPEPSVQLKAFQEWAGTGGFQAVSGTYGGAYANVSPVVAMDAAFKATALQDQIEWQKQLNQLITDRIEKDKQEMELMKTEAEYQTALRAQSPQYKPFPEVVTPAGGGAGQGNISITINADNIVATQQSVDEFARLLAQSMQRQGYL